VTLLLSINHSITRHFYSAIRRKRIRGAWWRKLGLSVLQSQ